MNYTLLATDALLRALLHSTDVYRQSSLFQQLAKKALFGISFFRLPQVRRIQEPSQRIGTQPFVSYMAAAF